MQKFIITCIMFAFSCAAFSDDEDLKDIYNTITTSINSAILTKKGNWQVSGAAFYNDVNTTVSGTEMTHRTFQAEPALSYFVVNDLALGLCGSYLYQETDGRKSEQKMFGPVAKMYFCSKRWRPFMLADFLFVMAERYEGGEADIGAGLLYHVAGNFGIAAHAKYGFFFPAVDRIEERNRLSVGLGIECFIF